MTHVPTLMSLRCHHTWHDPSIYQKKKFQQEHDSVLRHKVLFFCALHLCQWLSWVVGKSICKRQIKIHVSEKAYKFWKLSHWLGFVCKTRFILSEFFHKRGLQSFMKKTYNLFLFFHKRDLTIGRVWMNLPVYFVRTNKYIIYAYVCIYICKHIDTVYIYVNIYVCKHIYIYISPSGTNKWLRTTKTHMCTYI